MRNKPRNEAIVARKARTSSASRYEGGGLIGIFRF